MRFCLWWCMDVILNSLRTRVSFTGIHKSVLESCQSFRRYIRITSWPLLSGGVAVVYQLFHSFQQTALIVIHLLRLHFMHVAAVQTAFLQARRNLWQEPIAGTSLLMARQVKEDKDRKGREQKQTTYIQIQQPKKGNSQLYCVHLWQQKVLGLTMQLYWKKV